ncbi:hypothetical protein M9458_003138, partial [Cirrhinus mrigala]
VVLPGHTLIRWEFSPHVWELLWDLRTSLQAMIHRNLRRSQCQSTADDCKDGELIALLVELLNNTDSDSMSDQDEFSSVSTENTQADSL